MRIAVCSGSFDPITVGHLDLVERAAVLFDEVIVCVLVNGEKRYLFTLEERLELARGAIAHIPHARAESCGGLLADFARERGAQVLIKGARTGVDFDWELQMAQINRSLWPRLDTLILPARPEHLHISSTMVRELIKHQQNLDGCMPAGALAVLNRIKKGKGEGNGK